MENKQEFCNKLCEALRETDAAGSPINNPLVELRYMKLPNGDEIVRPIFANGTGCDINVTGDSCIAMFMDIDRQFVRKMW